MTNVALRFYTRSLWRRETSLHVKCPKVLSDFNSNWNMPTDFGKSANSVYQTVVRGPLWVREARPRGPLDYLIVLFSSIEKSCDMKYIRNKGKIRHCVF
jgi:hypothetical protein